MSKGDFTARVMKWTQRMRHEGDDDIANLLASLEMGKRKKPRAPRAKRAQVVAPDGRASKAWVNLANEQIQIVER